MYVFIYELISTNSPLAVDQSKAYRNLYANTGPGVAQRAIASCFRGHWRGHSMFFCGPIALLFWKTLVLFWTQLPDKTSRE